MEPSLFYGSLQKLFCLLLCLARSTGPRRRKEERRQVIYSAGTSDGSPCWSTFIHPSPAAAKGEERHKGGLKFSCHNAIVSA